MTLDLEPPVNSSTTPGRTLLFAAILLGGPLVIASYVYGAMNPPANGTIWGGVPDILRPLYTASMLCAAAGFFPFTWLIAFKTDPAEARIGPFGYEIFPPLYAAVMLCSAAWLPLTNLLLDAPSVALWVAVRGVLFGAALGSLGLAVAIFRLEPRTSHGWRVAALIGVGFFCWQTVVLDALVWPAYFPR
jgi:hypothetical protein